jgi:hypothetical protein
VACGVRATFGHRRFRFFQLRQDALAVFQEGRALIGQRQLARGALQQLDPRRASSASSRRPIMAGAMPSARAAAERLPLATTSTKVEICLNCPMNTCPRHFLQKRIDEVIFSLVCITNE